MVEIGRVVSFGTGVRILGGFVGVTELKLSVTIGSVGLLVGFGVGRAELRGDSVSCAAWTVGLFVVCMGLGLGVSLGTDVCSLNGFSVDNGLLVGIDEEISLLGEAV